VIDCERPELKSNCAAFPAASKRPFDLTCDSVTIKRLHFFSRWWIAAAILRSLSGCASTPRSALAGRQPPSPYLNMPPWTGGVLPRLLSQTGAFKDTARLVPANGLIPYDLNVSFWADGAWKSRWVALPPGRIGFAAKGEWTFPAGTVFVKQFELATNEAHPSQRRRLETRLLVRDANGYVYGATYKWRPDNRDADLLTTNLVEEIPIHTDAGTRKQTWYYPSRADCLTCHTERAGGVLGVKTRQLNREFTYPNGVTENELQAWNAAGLFSPPLTQDALDSCDGLARADDFSRSLEDRARSYLDVNCGNCHRPGGTVAYFDTRYDTPLEKQGLMNGPVLINEGVDYARIIAPRDIWRSILFMRAATVEAIKMPPLAHETVDRSGVALLRQWIEGLNGRPVLAPPEFLLPGGSYPAPIDVKLSQSEAGAEIHYTLDGSIPGTTDPLYRGALHLVDSATVRAKSFKTGFTRSITSQQTYIIGQ
jgi:uncharacterized repeat protein (TIGR03806 family)